MDFNLKGSMDDELKTELEEYDARVEAEIEARRQNKDAKHKKADRTFITVFWIVIVIGLAACFFSVL